ncbi:PEP-CTERM sorting domain-containing protein [Massilia pseudoviolaceinigra]|uniref:PEP-CTERM sorting domain-containing protein n=1 Tax=Massilia pseudoviolaceinigra TaxID=3057165 RepID=UPI0027968E2C|nr:PEP-CTERM sorting domain-containing protein [Massilia sp. CCM 9206]MDQ1922740.1 PEP-CTERM sorting domain-containing protein [Massilia sp. CCM 9206]
MAQHYPLATVASALFGFTLSLAAHGAQAAPGISVGAAVSNSRLTVIDLTPDDGQAAGYTFLGSGNSSVDATIESPSNSLNRNDAAHSHLLASIAATVAYGASTSSSSASQFGEVRADVQVHDNVGHRGNAMGNVVQSTTLLIAPHTQVIYSGYGEVSMSDAGQKGPPSFFGEAVTTVYFGSEVWIRGMGQGFAGHNDSGIRGGEFSMSFFNHGDTAEYAFLGVNLVTRALYQAPSPVPEPATYAMFGLGALMVGAMARRRRRAA